MTDRFDIVLWGATGFTGAIVAEYLAEHHAGLRWAIAGRNQSKLEAVRAGLPASAKDVPILIGDSADLASLEAIAAKAKVVCTTVGPYMKYGAALVEACVKNGTHYCDLTGEAPFVRHMADRFHDAAKESGARIVHCCGFDSIPSDIGVWMLHRHFEAKERRPQRARFRVMRMGGAFSGGTAASAANMFEQAARDPSIRKIAGDPYGLLPAGAPRGQDRGDLMKPKKDRESGRWMAPFIMAGINTRVVRRSNALLDFPYGEDFRYDETVDTGTGLKGAMRAYSMSFGLGLFAVGMATGPTRSLLQKTVLPAPGEGPSREQRDSGKFTIHIHAEAAGDPALKVRGVVKGYKDPGYGETAKMLGEAAVCLATGPDGEGGVLTPASAMGDALLERLRGAGMTFEVEAV